MRTPAPPLLPIFRSELQARLLVAFLLGDGEPLTSRALAERTGASAASLHRELRRLEDAGIIEYDKVGRTKLYRAAASSPVHAPLRVLVERTLGVEELLRATLERVPGIEAAAIFGSWAAGRVAAASDIDVLVVGEMDRRDLLAQVRKVEEIVGREVNVTAFDPADFERRRRADAGFVATILSRPVIQLVGELPGA